MKNSSGKCLCFVVAVQFSSKDSLVATTLKKFNIFYFKKEIKKSKFIPSIIEYCLLVEHREEKIQYFVGKRGKRVWPFCFCASAE